MQFGGSWQAPYGVSVASSLTIQAGPWSGAIIDWLDANDQTRDVRAGYIHVNDWCPVIEPAGDADGVRLSDAEGPDAGVNPRLRATYSICSTPENFN
jgi:hypothetical protein